MPSGRLLIVAPESAMRQSLLFALEAEGYALVVRDEPPTLAWLAKNRFDCTIADQKALTGEDYVSVAFCIKAHPVVLLAAQPHPWLVEWVAQTVELPPADNAIVAAIRAVTHSDP